MKRFSIGWKLYIFIIATVLFAVAGVCALSFFIYADQIDTYYKNLTINCAHTFSEYVDIEFMTELRNVAESEEYQALRSEAEEKDDEELVIAYLEQEGLWEKYEEERTEMRTFVSNMKDIEYLYIIVMGKDYDSQGVAHDMYLLDADDVEAYETGYYEEREDAFKGVDMQGIVRPVISEGDWGILCSGYYPIYNEEGDLICHVGCDISMDEVMSQRKLLLSYMLTGALVCLLIILLFAIIFVNKIIVSPLNSITHELKKFSPSENKNYEEAGVINLNIKGRDEINDIYDELRSMQIRIVDYINSINAITIEKEKAEIEARDKGRMIDEISIEALKDALTGIGNKNAYQKKIKEIETGMKTERVRFSVVMVDVNRLKMINDNHGHSAGDLYLKGCCHCICEVFKHSPVYRIGGDEFVAILTGEDYKERAKRVQELRDTFERTFNDEDVDPWFRYSASVGMAINDLEDDSFDSVFKRADNLMYEEKMRFKKENLN